MCGIAGLLQTSGSSEVGLPLVRGGSISAREAAERMLACLHHRGPDGCGIADVGRAPGDDSSSAVRPVRSAQGRLPSAVLAHTRLAILDLSPAGRQPMASEDGALWITYNGETYNFLELREELSAQGESWRSRTDTEVILKAYKRWGRGCLDRLRGMFGFAIWDDRLRELFLARDRLGIKPLYFYAGDGFFLFASEVRALLASGLVPRRLDPVGLWQYLAYQSVPAPRTLVEGVRALPPGSWLTVEADGNATEVRYWDLLENASPEAARADEAESRRRVAELLRESVRLHLVSDVPVGAFISGGIDSSAVVALMREAGAVPRTFTVGFAERSFDETAYARQVAERYRTDHTEVLLKEGDLLEQVPAALAAMDQPSGDGVNTYIVSRAVTGVGIKVALSGLGGDELFGGYPSFARLERSALLFRAWGHAPSAVRKLTAATVRTLGRSSVGASKAAAMLETDGSLAALYPVQREVLSRDQRRALFEPCWLDAVVETPDPYVHLLKHSFNGHHSGPRSPGPGPLAHVSYAEARTYMHDVLLRDTDQMSMAHSLETRVPLLDHALAEYVVGLPDRFKRSNGTPKRLLVESLGGLLPDDVVHRPKQGFTLPFDPWMRGPLRGFCEERLGPERLGGRAIFRPDQLRSLWRDFLAGRPSVSWSRLWLLVALEEWLGRNGL